MKEPWLFLFRVGLILLFLFPLPMNKISMRGKTYKQQLPERLLFVAIGPAILLLWYSLVR